MSRIDIIRRGDWPSQQDRNELMAEVNKVRQLFRRRQAEWHGVISVDDLQGVKRRVDRLIFQAFRIYTGRRTGKLPPKILPQLKISREGAGAAVDDTFMRPRLRLKYDIIFAEDPRIAFEYFLSALLPHYLRAGQKGKKQSKLDYAEVAWREKFKRPFSRSWPEQRPRKTGSRPSNR